MSTALSKPTWRTAAIVVTLAVAIGRRHFDGAIREVLVGLACVLFIFKIYQGLKSSAARMAVARKQSKRGTELWREFFPPWFRGIAITEGLIYLEFMSRVLRFTPPSQRHVSASASDKRFSLSKGNVSTMLVPLAVVGLLADVPLSQVIIRIWEPRNALWIHGVFLALALWGFVWILGDRFAVKGRDHLVGSARILLCVGFRWEVRIPISAIQHCGPIEGHPREWQAKREIDRKQVWSVTPVDSPNVLLELNNEMAGAISVLRMGAAVPNRSFVAVYVDEPSAFMTIVRREMTNSNGGKQDE